MSPTTTAALVLGLSVIQLAGSITLAVIVTRRRKFDLRMRKLREDAEPEREPVSLLAQIKKWQDESALRDTNQSSGNDDTGSPNNFGNLPPYGAAPTTASKE